MSTFPQPFKSTVSHWQATNRGQTSLYNVDHGPLPEIADIVIVGGGIMGASLAYQLTRPGAHGEGKKIVLLEAKDAGSGASGRNGGHVGPSTYESFHSLIQPYPSGAGLSVPEAVKVIQAERDNLELIADIIDKEGIRDEVDFWKGDLCEVHATPSATRSMRRMHDQWQAARKACGLTGNGDTQFIDDEAEARRISRISRTSSVHLRPAGSVHSHKLVTALLKLAVDSKHSHLRLFPWTPVTSIAQAEKGWRIKTKDGHISASQLVLCTNAHTKNFFPDDALVRSHIRPRFAQCALITPTVAFSGRRALAHTYNMNDGRYYLVQTPDGGIVLGGGDEALVKSGKIEAGQRDGVEDDSQVLGVWTKLLADYCRTHFTGWGPEALGEGLTRTWSGIITNVKDSLPVVGEAPGRPGLFLAAGFNGHGMSRVFSVGQALEHTMRTGEWYDRLPRSFEWTHERLQKCARIDVELARQGKNADQMRLEAEYGSVAARPNEWSCQIM